MGLLAPCGPALQAVEPSLFRRAIERHSMYCPAGPQGRPPYTICGSEGAGGDAGLGCGEGGWVREACVGRAGAGAGVPAATALPRLARGGGASCAVRGRNGGSPRWRSRRSRLCWWCAAHSGPAGTPAGRRARWGRTGASGGCGTGRGVTLERAGGGGRGGGCRGLRRRGMLCYAQHQAQGAWTRGRALSVSVPRRACTGPQCTQCCPVRTGDGSSLGTVSAMQPAAR